MCLDQQTEGLKDGLKINVIIQNFQKSFDYMPHKRLIEKVKNTE